MFIRRFNSIGFSLIELMISMGLASVVALGVLSLNNVMNKSTASTNAYFQADAFRKQVTALLLNPAAWKQTIKAGNNTAYPFTCATTSGTCAAEKLYGPSAAQIAANAYPYSVSGAFKVYDSTGGVFYDSVTATNGFDLRGVQCSTYSTSGNNSCPFRLVLYWQPVCPSTTGCTGPAMIHVYGYTVYTPVIADKNRALGFNPGNYNVNAVLSPTP